MSTVLCVCQQLARFCCLCVDSSVGGAAVSSDDSVYNEKKKEEEGVQTERKIEGGRGKRSLRERDSQTERWFRSTRSTQL